MSEGFMLGWIAGAQIVHTFALAYIIIKVNGP